MLEEVVNQIVALKMVIICSAVTTLLLTVFSLVICRVFSWKGKNIKLVGFFYDLSVFDTIALGTCIMKVFVIVSLLFSGGRIEPVQIMAYAVLVLAYNFCRLDVKEFLPSIVNGAIIVGVLIVANMLSSYLREVLFDMRIAVALALLGVFLVLFALYDVASCVLRMIEYRK